MSSFMDRSGMRVRESFVDPRRQARQEPIGRALSMKRARYALVTNHAEVRERELIKLASLALAVTKALHARGVPEPAASLAAEVGIAVFKIGFERWVNEKKPRDLAAHILTAADALKAVAGEGNAPTKRPKKKPTRRT
jgi:hypothetical protein